MTGKVILPVNYPKIKGKVIFLGGPIVGAPKWHNRAIELIREEDQKVNIACPSYHENVDEIFHKDNPITLEDFTHTTPISWPIPGEEWPEVDWQRHYIENAFEEGCLLFWIPIEEEHTCSYPYSKTTSKELFEKLHLKGKMVLGIQRGSPDDMYNYYHFTKHRPETPIYFTLEDACNGAVRMVNNS